MCWYEIHVDGVFESFYFGGLKGARRFEKVNSREGRSCKLTAMSELDVEQLGRLTLRPDTYSGPAIVVGGGEAEPDHCWMADDAVETLDNSSRIDDDMADDPQLLMQRDIQLQRTLSRLKQEIWRNPK